MTEDRMRLLLDKAADLRSLADSLDMAAALLKGSKPQDLPAIDEEQEDASDRGMEQSPSLTDVRAILADKSRDGHTGQIRALLQKYGAPRLSEVDPVHYRELLDEALCLGATKADLESALAGKEREGLGDAFAAVFEHHGATGLDDLKAEYYPSFLRDVRRLCNG